MLNMLANNLCLHWAHYLMFVHDALEFGNSWQHSQNLTIQQQSSYNIQLLAKHIFLANILRNGLVTLKIYIIYRILS